MYEPDPPLRDQLRYWSPIMFALVLSLLVAAACRSTATEPAPSTVTRPPLTVVVTRLP